MPLLAWRLIPWEHIEGHLSLRRPTEQSVTEDTSQSPSQSIPRGCLTLVCAYCKIYRVNGRDVTLDIEGNQAMGAA